jgi:streptomycin 6-kinase
VVVDDTTETESSLIAYGSLRDEPVVLKIVRAPGDEWRAGDVLAAFRGCGVARVLTSADGAVLLERAMPGESLVELSRAGRDDEAIAILADTIAAMSSASPQCPAPSVGDWGRSFDEYRKSGDARIPATLIDHAETLFATLYASQQEARLLHGDLHHYNVIRDANRGWLAVDPKGVIGEVEYEIGAILRNPIDLPSLFLDQSAIERRADHFAATLQLNHDRILAWGFAQGVLSAIWSAQDGHDVTLGHAGLRLAELIRPMLG